MTRVVLDVAELAAITARPPVFAPGQDLWRDPHISKQMLAAHLDPGHDAASRRPEAIDRTVEWLVEFLGLEAGHRVLDLGCGPGLYCERLATRGLRVTGIDYSPGSIEYARDSARGQGLTIDYACQDYLTLDFSGRFDAALLIYYDLQVLPDTDRDALLARVARALRPGGRFAFDILTPAHRQGSESTEWSVSAGAGFWSPLPCLVLTQRLRYPESQAWLDQYTVIDRDGTRVFRVWERHYEPGEITALLGTHGLKVTYMGSDLSGTPLETGTRSLGIVARKHR